MITFKKYNVQLQNTSTDIARLCRSPNPAIAAAVYLQIRDTRNRWMTQESNMPSPYWLLELWLLSLVHLAITDGESTRQIAALLYLSPINQVWNSFKEKNKDILSLFGNCFLYSKANLIIFWQKTLLWKQGVF